MSFVGYKKGERKAVKRRKKNNLDAHVIEANKILWKIH